VSKREGYVIGFDIEDKAEHTTLSIFKTVGDKIQLVNTIIGPEALEIYEKLTNKSKGDVEK